MRTSSKIIFTLLLLPSIALAAPPFKRMAMLNRVAFQLSAEQWVSTNTAKVTVNVNASVSSQGLAQVQKNVMGKLQKIANQGKWHITSFNRSQDQSGLERVQISAQSRLPENALVNLRTKAKSISKPGETYTIADVSFTPSLTDVEKTRAILRQNILQQAKTNLEQLNKMYPNQNYVLHGVRFSGVVIRGAGRRGPRPMMMARVAAATPPLTVSNKLTLSATVVLASKMRKPKKANS